MALQFVLKVIQEHKEFMVDFKVLKDELTNDPQNLGYAALLAGEDDGLVADLLNQVGTSRVALDWITKEQLISGIFPAFIVLDSKDASIKSKWDRIFSAALSLEGINPTNQKTIMLFQMAIQDGLLVANDISIMSSREGSRGENLFGSNIKVHANDISNSLPDREVQRRKNEADLLSAQWKASEIIRLTDLANYLLNNTVSGKIGRFTPDNKFIPGTDEFAIALQTAMDRKGQTLDAADLVPIVQAEMMRIGGGR